MTLERILRLSRVVAVMAAFLAGGTVAARADASKDVLAHFTQDNYTDTSKGIEALPESGLKTASQILSALSDRRLLFDPQDHQVYFKDTAGFLFDAATGERAGGIDIGKLKTVRIKNALRTSIEAAVGNLSLRSPDPAQRRSAAYSIFHARNGADLKRVEAALDKETDLQVREALTQARAALIAGKPDASDADKLEAIGRLRARADGDAMTLLRQMRGDPSARVKAAADAGIVAVQAALSFWGYAQNVWYGLSLGSVLLLAAIGLAITFGVMGVINMAHGEMVMLGAYTTFVVQDTIRQSQPALFGYSLAIALPLAFVVAGATGILIERLVIRFLYGRPLETLLATWGVSLILQQAVRTAFGPNNREVGAPEWMAGSFRVAGLDIAYGRMWIIVFTIAVFLGLQLVLKATPFGLRIRAVTQNRRMASSMGINTGRMDALAFGLGSGIAGIAGVALSQIDNVSPNLGQSYIIDSFLVVVFGGVGSLWGTLVAALSLGVANKCLEPIVSAVLGKIVLLVFVILFIQKRPRGLFALKGRAAEA